jgi:hypothetical protein
MKSVHYLVEFQSSDSEGLYHRRFCATLPNWEQVKGLVENLRVDPNTYLRVIQVETPQEVRTEFTDFQVNDLLTGKMD